MRAGKISPKSKVSEFLNTTNMRTEDNQPTLEDKEAERDKGLAKKVKLVE